MIIDPRFNQLAAGLTGFSTQLKAGERILIDAFDVPDEMVVALIRAARARGAHPYVQLHRARITRELSFGAEEAQFAPHAEVELSALAAADQNDPTLPRSPYVGIQWVGIPQFQAIGTAVGQLVGALLQPHAPSVDDVLDKAQQATTRKMRAAGYLQP